MGTSCGFCSTCRSRTPCPKNLWVAESADELERVLDDLDLRRKAELPRAQVIDRARLDAIGGVSEKAVHQGIAAAVWPLDPPHFDMFLDGIKARLNQRKSQDSKVIIARSNIGSTQLWGDYAICASLRCCRHYHHFPQCCQ